jgi:hypothetical protein
MKINRIIILCIVMVAAACTNGNKPVLEETGTMPMISPDYTGVTIPYNIAPLNFSVNETCDRLIVTISGKAKETKMSFRGTKAFFPMKLWKRIMEENRNDTLSVTLTLLSGKQLKKYKPFSIFVSGIPVDGYLVYRKIMPGFQNWNQMGIYQRSLGSFSVETIIDSRVLPGTCMNCHSFASNDPSNMVFHLRESLPGTILLQNGKVRKLNTKTEKMFGAAAFPYWHPSKKFIAFSVNRVNQVFHAAGNFRAAAVDMRSDVFVYDIENNTMLTSPALSAAGKFESFPCFSPDGLKLYYCSADSIQLPQKFSSIRYSLCSVSFDPATGRLGETADTLISCHVTNRSVSIPRISPDGRFLMFCMADYGCFPSYNPEADLYMLDLKTGKYEPLTALNSDNVDSYHSWSSEGRWVVFTSRRGDGLYAKPYIAFIDENGKGYKPFLLPQKDPAFYDSYLFSYNVPELIKSRVQLDPYEVEKLVRKTPGVQVDSGSSH